MTAFFVGQRVRLARPTRAENQGLEGHILKLGPFLADHPTGYGLAESDCDCVVDWIAIGAAIQDFGQLEPILPSGHRPAELTVEELLPFLNERAQA